MEQRLVQTQSQRLILSPLIRQYLKLLQLPAAELQNIIEQELAENPVLEDAPQDPGEEMTPGPAVEELQKKEGSAEELRFDETLKNLDKLDQSTYEGMYSQDDFSLPDVQQFKNKKNYEETLITGKETLSDYLFWQLGFLDLNDEDRRITEEIIGNLNEEGFLAASLEDIAQRCQVPLPRVEGILTALQTLDPPGIAARNLQETLLLQLERKGPEAALAKRVVRDHLTLLEKKDWDSIAKHTGESLENVRRSAELISHLDPKPGRTFYAEDSQAVTPDASVSFDESDESADGKLVVDIADETLPELRVSGYYRKLVRDPDLDEASRRFLKEKIQSAVDFVKALSQRRSTLREITEEIVAAQREFFEKGFSHLRPLRLKDISARLGIHESTVSRAIQGKYLSTPRGTIPYKSFFSTKLETAGGEAESQKSIMEKIREIIRGEDPRHPLSDQAICEHLQQEGIKIARRTVAKYRELLKILPTHLRKQK